MMQRLGQSFNSAGIALFARVAWVSMAVAGWVAAAVGFAPLSHPAPDGRGCLMAVSCVSLPGPNML